MVVIALVHHNGGAKLGSAGRLYDTARGVVDAPVWTRPLSHYPKQTGLAPTAAPSASAP
jgi:hypothetical protein